MEEIKQCESGKWWAISDTAKDGYIPIKEYHRTNHSTFEDCTPIPREDITETKWIPPKCEYWVFVENGIEITYVVDDHPTWETMYIQEVD